MFRLSTRHALASGALTALAGGLAFGGHAHPTRADDMTISINGFALNPDPATINAGATLTWENHQDVAHTVTADDFSFDLGQLNPGDTTSLNFASAGTYTYHREIHANMHGTVTVVDPSASGN